MSPDAGVLVTGASGFVGTHLMRVLEADGHRWRVHGWRSGTGGGAVPGSRSSNVELEDAVQVTQAIAAARPAYLVHLAAASNVAGSFHSPQRTWAVNVLGWLNLLEALRKESPQTKVLFVSSSEVYGESFKAGAPLDEEAPVKPLNPYAASKAAAEVLTQTYVRQGLRIVTVRPFNHVGPGQSEGFAIASFAAQIARIEAGQHEPQLRVGNLDASRDFHDVRDTVQAYVAVLRRFDTLPQGAVFNLCSGRSRRVGEVLEQLLALSRTAIEVVTDPARLRPSDIPVASGDSSMLARYLHWRPLIPWDQTLGDVLDDWRHRVGRAGT